MIDMFARYIIPAAYSILPPSMNSPQATAMILAIGLQESGFRHRSQGGGGPAKGFVQFERAGVNGVKKHPKTREPMAEALRALCYVPDDSQGSPAQTTTLMTAIAHNDVLASVFARLLLWTVAGALPSATEPERAYAQYLEGWRPGRPRPDTWAAHFARAWTVVRSDG